MSDESIINLSDETKAQMRNNAMIAGFMMIFVLSAIMLINGLTVSSLMGGETVPGDMTPPEGSGGIAGLDMVHVITGVLLLLISVILAMLHKRDQVAITFMIIGLSFFVIWVSSMFFGAESLSGVKISVCICILLMGIMLLFTHNEQRYVSALILIPYGALQVVANDPIVSAIGYAILAIVSLYCILCLGIERFDLPGRSILTADEDDESKDGSPVHFKIAGSMLGYTLALMAPLTGILACLGLFGIDYTTVQVIMLSSGFAIMLVGLIMLVVGRMKFTPFMFMMLGLCMVVYIMTGNGGLSCVFFLIIGILCLFRSDRRILVGTAIVVYAIGALFAPNGTFPNDILSLIFCIIPLVIYAYVGFALCSDNRLKLI